MLDDARAMGLPGAAIAAIAAVLDAENADEEAGLWPQHVAAAEAFLVASTQWRVAAGMSRLHFLGLDYAGARAGIELAGIAITPQLWSELRVMEIAALAALNGDDA